ncbi:sodium:solute symporter family transporter [Streptomyces nymphaeiformis]|uniref:Na+(H+)/acetate symporter ActP n=1 Tax=Streptomyces nymphaeiformis TaxID=2663842 RepID=A0A7W7U8D9_9ACTN|nr:hypothetical protein [Streptomyces nymphaeiformis]MBB4986856.1 Na+(H+)/acetate symporter ActP [Streptomyces nymphaeiformis]
MAPRRPCTGGSRWASSGGFGTAARAPVISAFLVSVGLCLLWVFTLASQDDRPERLHVADRSLSPLLDGLALAGEQITIVVLVAVTGVVALFGCDGFSSAVDSVIALAVLIPFAQKIRDTGGYTLGDFFSQRASGPGPRRAAPVVTLVITPPLLMVQLRAGDISAALLIGMPTGTAQVACMIMMGFLVAFHGYPIEFLVTFSLGVTASCVFPVLVYSFFWRGFDHRGLQWSVYGGLFLCTVLTFFSPTVSGTDYALWPRADFDWYPLHAPGLVSVPAAFLLGWLGSRRSRAATAPVPRHP